jgi:lysophospholipase L1-like esterase
MTTAQISQGSQGMMERIRPNIVVIQVGINDLKLLGPRPELREAVIDTCVSNILAVVRECRAMGAQVILTTVWPTGEVSTARRFVWSSAVEAGIHETNARLEKRLAAIPHVTVTNLLAAASVDLPPGKNYTLYRDTLHLRPAAYARLSKVLVETISSRSGNRSETK